MGKPVRNPARVSAALREATYAVHGTDQRVGQMLVNALTLLHRHGTAFALTDLFYIEDNELAEILEKYAERP